MSYPTLMLGSNGPEVGNWQRFLNSLKMTDWTGMPLRVDESFGQKTLYLTRQWQAERGLPTTGLVRDAERAIALVNGFIPFVQARNYTPVYPKSRFINMIVLHTMEAPEKPTTAENVAHWFAGGSAPKASAHYCVGQTGLVQCVRDDDVAWHAPGANAHGIGIEHEGYASQTKEEWADVASKATLWRSARLVASLTRKHVIPIRRLTLQEIKTGQSGLCGHKDITDALNDGKGHWDPGPAFPWDDYLDMVREAL